MKPLPRPDRTLAHVTLSSGDNRASPRNEVKDDVLRDLRPLIERVVAGEDVPMPYVGEGLTITGAAGGDCLLATVWGREHEPIVSIGVARGLREAAELWTMLHRTAVGIETVTSADAPPEAPWCAARLEVGIALDAYAGTVHWLGDFERCWAWAWVESRARRDLQRLQEPERPRRVDLGGRKPRSRLH